METEIIYLMIYSSILKCFGNFFKIQHSCQNELFVRGDSIATYVKIFSPIFQSVRNLQGKSEFI